MSKIFSTFAAKFIKVNMESVIFKRKAYQKLLEWKRDSAGKTALLIEGARRIGKSTLVEQFAKKEYKSYILIDFANIKPQVSNLIANGFADLDDFFTRLQFLSGVQLYERQSLIIFDEVQLQPLARQAIKYLVKASASAV
jgi:predicted AAA+ superfamily ATPase